MLRSTDRTLPLALVFALLVAIGVVGRWGQPAFAVTPIAAIGLLAGYALPRWLAITTPLAAMLITDLALPSYGSLGLAVAVYAAMAISPLLGRLLSRPAADRWVGLSRLIAVAAAPSLVFFVVTNFAVWAFTSNYPSSLTGLAACYAAAVPFFRAMLAGDMAFVAVLFTAASLAGVYSLTGRAAGNDAVAEGAR